MDHNVSARRPRLEWFTRLPGRSLHDENCMGGFHTIKTSFFVKRGNFGHPVQYFFKWKTIVDTRGKKHFNPAARWYMEVWKEYPACENRRTTCSRPDDNWRSWPF